MEQSIATDVATEIVGLTVTGPVAVVRPDSTKDQRVTGPVPITVR